MTRIIASFRKKRAGKAKKDKVYHFLEKGYERRRNLLNSVTINRNVVNNLFSSQNQQQGDADVWYAPVETQGVCTEGTRGSSTLRVSVDEQAGTSGTQNETEEGV